MGTGWSYRRSVSILNHFYGNLTKKSFKKTCEPKKCQKLLELTQTTPNPANNYRCERIILSDFNVINTLCSIYELLKANLIFFNERVVYTTIITVIIAVFTLNENVVAYKCFAVLKDAININDICRDDKIEYCIHFN